jgi:hypothetical protein
MPLNMRFPNLVTLGGVELTDESRTPLQEERDERSIIVDLASGRKKKFVQGVRRRWTISWENVAANASETVDGKGGRDEMRSLSEGAGFITFVLDDGRNTQETYTVMLENYSEEVLTRRGVGGFRYKVDMTIVEQG